MLETGRLKDVEQAQTQVIRSCKWVESEVTRISRKEERKAVVEQRNRTCETERRERERQAKLRKIRSIEIRQSAPLARAEVTARRKYLSLR